MVIQHNLEAFNVNRMFGLTRTSMTKTTERLSSGYKINRAADNAAGLAISEKMRRQIRGLTQASVNCQDGVSLCQIADGALNEVHDILKRCEELAIQAANDTNSEKDREFIQSELDALTAEIDRVHTTTVFNEQNIFSQYGIVPAFVSSENTKADVIKNSNGDYIVSTSFGKTISLSIIDINGNKISAPEEAGAVGTVNTDSEKNSSIAGFTQDAAANAVARIASAYPRLFAKASTDNIQVGLQLRNIDGENGTLATASLAINSNSDRAIMSYSMSIDISDYPIDEFDSFDDEKKADLAAVIAHEMTHLITYDTVTRNSFRGGHSRDDEVYTGMNHWLIEGLAQTSSGDNGWFYLDSESSDAEIKQYMATLKDVFGGGESAVGTYGAGYAATMYIGMLASGEAMTDITSQNIAKGLDNFMSYLSDADHSLDATVKQFTGYNDMVAFQNAFRAGKDGSFDFMKGLITARGSNGAGSILYDLNESEKTAFAPSGLTQSYNSYTINADNKWYANYFGAGNLPDDYFVPDSPSRPSGGGAGGYGFTLQVGSESDQTIHVDQYNVSSEALFGGMKMIVKGSYGKGFVESGYGSLVSYDDAAARGNTIEAIKEADRRVSLVRSYYGATQNRLEHAINNLNKVVENTTAAESRIRDTDMASEMVKHSILSILSQAGQTMLAQANQSKQGIMALLS